jgi:hypothetical protein
MAVTYQTRVQEYTGTVSLTDQLNNVLSAGAKFIVNAIPSDKLDKYASNYTDAGSGIDISVVRIVRAHKGGYRARKIDAGLRVQALPSGGLSTVSIVSGGTGYALNNVLTLSQGTSGTCTVTGVLAGVVTSVEITTTGSGYTQGVKTTTVAPAGGSSCTLYVIPSNNSIYQATTLDPNWYVENTLGYIIPGGGTIIGVPYPDVAYNADPASYPANFPTELKQGIVLYAALQIFLGKANTIYDAITSLSMDSVSAPTPPSAASFSFSSTTYNVAAYSAGTFTPATIDVTTATTLGVIPTPPTYTAPTSTFSVGDGSTASTARYFVITEEDGAKASAEIQAQSAILDKFGKDQYNALNTFNANLENQKLAVNHLITQAQLDQQRLIDQSQKVVELNKYNAKIAIDTALANAQQTTAVDIQNKAKALESDIVNKTKTLEASIQQYQSNLQLYLGQLDSYGHDINKAVQKYSLGIQKNVSQLTGIAGLIEQVRKEFQIILSNL